MNPELITVDNNVEIRMDNYEDRRAFITALTNSGYIVQVIEKQDPTVPLFNRNYYIKFSTPVKS